MNVTLHQLRIFVEVSTAGTVTRAAERLHLSQPAVSVQVRNLQAEFETPLLELRGRRYELTEFGRAFASEAAEILARVEDIGERERAYRGLLTGRLDLAIVSTGTYVLPFFLRGFAEAHPGIRLHVEVTNKRSVLERLRERSIDFALVSLLPEDVPVDHVPLVENRLYLFGAPERPVPADLSAAAFAELPFIVREQGSGTRLTMERFLRSRKLNYRPRLELDGNEAVKQAVIAGLGFSIMPLIGMRGSLQEGLIEVYPLDGLPVRSTWHLTYNHGRQLSPAATRFLAYVEREKDRIISEEFAWYVDYGNANATDPM